MRSSAKTAACLMGTIGSLLMGGCWWLTLEPIQAPYVTREPPYAVILQFPYKENERILDLVVRQELGARYDHTYSFSTCWQIRATRPVPAMGFQVQMGRVPEGFTQLVPMNEDQFLPVPGGKYVLAITTTNKKAHYRTWWAPAEQ
jgi:hypothetical protein